MGATWQSVLERGPRESWMDWMKKGNSTVPWLWSVGSRLFALLPMGVRPSALDSGQGVPSTSSRLHRVLAHSATQVVQR